MKGGKGMGWNDRMLGFVFLSIQRKTWLRALLVDTQYFLLSHICQGCRLVKMQNHNCCTSFKTGWKGRGWFGGFVFLSRGKLASAAAAAADGGRASMNIWCYFPRPASRCFLGEGLQFLLLDLVFFWFLPFFVWRVWLQFLVFRFNIWDFLRGMQFLLFRFKFLD